MAEDNDGCFSSIIGLVLGLVVFALCYVLSYVICNRKTKNAINKFF